MRAVLILRSTCYDAHAINSILKFVAPNDVTTHHGAGTRSVGDQQSIADIKGVEGPDVAEAAFPIA